MLGIDAHTGRMVTDFDQLISRIIQVLTTGKKTRVKRGEFGTLGRTLSAKNMTPSRLARLQNMTIAAFYEPANGLLDFVVIRCVATATRDGVLLQLSGVWQNQSKNIDVVVS